ncbi:MAG: tetratricopeptide repeat protein [Egibacteraceae bacterium]
MQWEHTSLRFSPELVGHAIVLEAEPGQARDAVVQQWLAKSRENGAVTWLLRCAYDWGGMWAGLADLLQDLVPQIRQRAPQLLAKHSYELCLVLPTLRQDLVVRNPTLTDIASGHEKTRNFPADRAYRSLHGLINLLDAWHRLGDGSPWTIACDQYDRANSLIHRFFAELMRRRGRHLHLSLLVVTAPGTGDAVMRRFDPSAVAQAVRLELPSTRHAPADKNHMTELARELEQKVKQDAVAQEMHLPRLIRYWQQSELPQNAMRWQIKAMQIYNYRGLYEAAAVYSASVEADLDRLYAEDRAQYYLAVDALYYSCLLVGEVERAQRLLEDWIVRTKDPARLAPLYYLMAMQYARYLPTTDLAEAEEYLQGALNLLPEADVPDEERHFLTVFNWNGLAFVRVRQGRPQEALDLCRAGIAQLNAHLRPDRHRLHRSVLLYNIAQVHAQIGPYEEALTYFEAAMAMDPNYSEYYNEYGNVQFKMGSLHEAEQDYLKAIELSPPYPEVWTNLGQCYRSMGRMADAVRVYSTALDLDPTMTLALAGRAEAYTALSQPRAALADYDTALALDQAQPLVLSNRAVLHYQAGRVRAALDDLDKAVALAHQTPQLYKNRAVALRDLGRNDEAARDLRFYLQLCPDAEDRGEVERTLSALQSAIA